MAREPNGDKSPTVEELNEQIAELKAKLSDLADEAQERGEEFVGAARRRARRAYRAASDQASHLRDRASGYFDDADTAVREHPATAMGIAVGVGFALGLLLARR